MDSHSGQTFAPCEDVQTWQLFTNHDMTDSYDQEFPYLLSLPSCESLPTLTSSSDSCLSVSEPRGPSSSASPSAPSSHRKSRRTSPGGTITITDRTARRRQQNRNSQRAYRDRKEAYQKNLEDQVDDLKQKHTKLYDSFTSQCRTLSRLRATMSDLNSQIVSLQAGMCRTLSSVDLSQHEPELFIITDTKYEFLHYLPGES